jgi:hypothetical protein
MLSIVKEICLTNIVNVSDNVIRRKTYKIATEEDILEDIPHYSNSISELKNLPIKIKLELIKTNSKLFMTFKNPTDKLKLLALNIDGYILKYIKNPTEQMKILAVKNDGRSISLIKNPTDEMKYLAIENDPMSIEYIKNPTEQMKILAITNDGLSIQFVRDPTDEMKCLAVKQNRLAINHIDNPSIELINEANRQTGVFVGREFPCYENDWLYRDDLGEDFCVINDNGTIKILDCSGKILTEIINQDRMVYLCTHNTIDNRTNDMFLYYVLHPSKELILAATNQKINVSNFIEGRPYL